MSTLHWRGTRERLVAELRKLPKVLSGVEGDPYGLGAILLAHIGNAILRCIAQDFDTKASGGRGRDGVKWKELAAETLRKRREKGYSGSEILKESEDLRRALEAGSDDPDAVRVFGQLFEIVSGSVCVGVDEDEIPYARFHQEGTAHMAARPIVPTDGLIPSAWEPELNAALEKGMEKVIEVMCDRGGVS